MEKLKTIIYILVCIGMATIAGFIKELGIFSVLFAYLLGVSLGYVIWKK